MKLVTVVPFLIFSLVFMSACSYDPTVDISHAGSFDNTKNLQKYLDRGVNVNTKDEDGDTALMTAVTFGHLDNIKLLLAKGANVHLRNKDGETALNSLPVFPKKNDEKILKLLLAKGANINAKDKEGDTALSTAVLFSRVDYVRMLLKSGANMNIKDKDGDTITSSACSAENTKEKEILKMFLAKGAKCN